MDQQQHDLLEKHKSLEAELEEAEKREKMWIDKVEGIRQRIRHYEDVKRDLLIDEEKQRAGNADLYAKLTAMKAKLREGRHLNKYQQSMYRQDHAQLLRHERELTEQQAINSKRLKQLEEALQVQSLSAEKILEKRRTPNSYMQDLLETRDQAADQFRERQKKATKLSDLEESIKLLEVRLDSLKLTHVDAIERQRTQSKRLSDYRRNVSTKRSVDIAVENWQSKVDAAIETKNREEQKLSQYKTILKRILDAQR